MNTIKNGARIAEIKRKWLAAAITLIVMLLTLASCDRPVTHGGSDNITFSIGLATEEQLSNESDYAHIYDEAAMHTDWKIIVTVNGDADSFCFVELVESEDGAEEVGRILFEADNVKSGSSFIFHTYINDATMNRGISYKDKNGKVKTFGIDMNMDDGTVSLKEL